MTLTESRRLASVFAKPQSSGTLFINTHSHSDHSGSNEGFPATVERFAHDNTKANMAKMAEFGGSKAQFAASRTFKDKISVGKGKDAIDLYYFGRGHTNGDIFIVFPALRTMHTGDLFAQKQLPLVDTANGGSLLDYPQTLAKAVAGIRNVDTVIPGHRQVGSWNEFKEYADFIKDLVDYARSAMSAKKTVAQAASEYKIPAKYKGYVVTIDPSLTSAERILQTAYDESKK